MLVKSEFQINYVDESGEDRTTSKVATREEALEILLELNKNNITNPVLVEITNNKNLLGSELTIVTTSTETTPLNSFTTLLYLVQSEIHYLHLISSKGPGWRRLHELCDEYYSRLLEDYDRAAELCMQVGVPLQDPSSVSFEQPLALEYTREELISQIYQSIHTLCEVAITVLPYECDNELSTVSVTTFIEEFISYWAKETDYKLTNMLNSSKKLPLSCLEEIEYAFKAGFISVEEVGPLLENIGEDPDKAVNLMREWLNYNLVASRRALLKDLLNNREIHMNINSSKEQAALIACDGSEYLYSLAEQYAAGIITEEDLRYEDLELGDEEKIIEAGDILNSSKTLDSVILNSSLKDNWDAVKNFISRLRTKGIKAKDEVIKNLKDAYSWMTDQLAGEAYHQYYVAAKRKISSNKLSSAVKWDIRPSTDGKVGLWEIHTDGTEKLVAVGSTEEDVWEQYGNPSPKLSSNKILDQFDSLEDVEEAFKSGKINTIFEVQSLLEAVDEDPTLAVMFVNQWTEEAGLVDSKKTLNSNKERLQESIDNEDTELFTAEDWRKAVQFGIISEEELHEKLKSMGVNDIFPSEFQPEPTSSRFHKLTSSQKKSIIAESKISSARGEKKGYDQDIRVKFMEFLQQIPSIPNPPTTKNQVMMDSTKGEDGFDHLSYFFIFAAPDGHSYSIELHTAFEEDDHEGSIYVNAESTGETLLVDHYVADVEDFDTNDIEVVNEVLGEAISTGRKSRKGTLEFKTLEELFNFYKAGKISPEDFIQEASVLGMSEEAANLELDKMGRNKFVAANLKKLLAKKISSKRINSSYDDVSQRMYDFLEDEAILDLDLIPELVEQIWVFYSDMGFPVPEIIKSFQSGLKSQQEISKEIGDQLSSSKRLNSNTLIFDPVLIEAIRGTWSELSYDVPDVSDNKEAIELVLDADRLRIQGFTEAASILKDMIDGLGYDLVFEELVQQVKLV